MLRTLLLALQALVPISDTEIEPLVQQIRGRIDPQDIQWAQDQVDLGRESFRLFLEEGSLAQQAPCKNTASFSPLEEPEIRVFMSFSVPETIWVQLSRELEPLGGVFVLRGLPNNSFSELAQRIRALGETGVNAPIQIDPEAFVEFDVHAVPTMVRTSSKGIDKISGNISLRWAMEKMAQEVR